MRHILLATDPQCRTARRAAINALLLIAAASCVWASRGQETSSVAVAFDLTAKVPADMESGAMPGAQGGGTVGGRSLATPGYQLPLETRIVKASVNQEGDFLIELSLTNNGSVPFDLPISRNVRKVEEAENKSRRIFSFQVRRVEEGQREPKSIDGRATGGSTSMPNSFLRLRPRQTVRILLPAGANWVKQALPKGAERVEINVTCGEWTLEDGRFFLRAIADDLPSVNTAILAFQNGKPVVVRP